MPLPPKGSTDCQLHIFGDIKRYATANGPLHNPRARVMEAQWFRLHQLGAVQIPNTGALCSYIELVIHSPCRISHTALTGEQADRFIELFGARIRKTQEEQKTGQESES